MIRPLTTVNSLHLNEKAGFILVSRLREHNCIKDRKFAQGRDENESDSV